MTDETSYEGQLALVTGGSRGIGAAIAQELASRGVRVLATATSEEGAERITKALDDYKGCRGLVLDVNDKQQLETTVGNIVKQEGALHILVNNAGITRDGLALRMSDEDWGAVLSTNLRAVFQLCRVVMRPMMKQRYGRIVNITSIVGASGNPGQANYAAAKAGVAGMTRALAHELASRNVTVNCVAPGFIATDMTASLPEKQQDALIAQIPMHRLGRPADVAAAVAYLASPHAAYVTGQQLHVNGGMLMT